MAGAHLDTFLAQADIASDITHDQWRGIAIGLIAMRSFSAFLSAVGNVFTKNAETKIPALHQGRLFMYAVAYGIAWLALPPLYIATLMNPMHNLGFKAIAETGLTEFAHFTLLVSMYNTVVGIGLTALIQFWRNVSGSDIGL